MSLHHVMSSQLRIELTNAQSPGPAAYKHVLRKMENTCKLRSPRSHALPPRPVPPRAQLPVPAVTSESPPPVAPCHRYSCRARWRRHGRGVITSGHKQAIYSELETRGGHVYTLGRVVRVFNLSAGVSTYFPFTPSDGFFLISFHNVHVVAPLG